MVTTNAATMSHINVGVGDADPSTSGPSAFALVGVAVRPGATSGSLVGASAGAVGCPVADAPEVEAVDRALVAAVGPGGCDPAPVPGVFDGAVPLGGGAATGATVEVGTGAVVVTGTIVEVVDAALAVAVKVTGA
jgi:hypothetical protein